FRLVVELVAVIELTTPTGRRRRGLSFGDRQDRRHEVREAFAHTCAGFDDQMRLCANRSLDGLSHFELLWSRLVSGQPLRDATFLTQNRADVQVHGSLWNPTKQMSSLCTR